MKITILNTYDISGGAARAMYRLHQGLKLIGEDSKILSLYKHSQDDTVFELSPNYRLEFTNPSFYYKSSLVQEYIQTHRTSLSNTLFSFPYPDCELSSHPRILESDVINLHWVAYFQSARTIQKLLKLQKPIVWTLHDEWAFTGGCHYTAGCEGFIKDCANCPQIQTLNSFIPSWVLSQKLKAFSKEIVIITPSKWLAKQVKKSILFKENQIEVIPYSLDIETFSPKTKLEAKAYWNIPETTFTLLFGAENGNERRKGFLELVEALKILSQKTSWHSAVSDGKILILLFGTPARELQELKIPYLSLGHIKEDSLLALAYSAADLFVLPSLEDNLPNTMLESLSCATPVVAFETGGMPDLVIPNYTGYLAELKNPSSLAEKILQAFQNPAEREKLGKNGAEWMKKNFHLPIQAEKYKKLFEELVSKKSKKRIISKFTSSTESLEIPKPILEEIYFQKENNLIEKLFVAYTEYKKVVAIEQSLQKSFNQIAQEYKKVVALEQSLQKSFNQIAQEYKKVVALENYSLSRVQVFFSQNGEFDFTKGIQTYLPSSLQKTQFYLECKTNQVVNFTDSTPYEIKNPTSVLFLPSLRVPFKILLKKVVFYLESGEKLESDFNLISGTWSIRRKNYFVFYHGHGFLVVPISTPGVIGVEITGIWNLLDTWEAFEGLNKIIQKKDEILNSKVNRLSMKIGNALAKLLRWVLKAREKK